jgi:hypothetical protein
MKHHDPSNLEIACGAAAFFFLFIVLLFIAI